MSEPAREVREWRWTCDACGTVFFTDRSRRRRFCSLPCSASYLANQWWQNDREGMRQKISARLIARAPLIERFTASYVVDPNGCWIWQKTKDRKGYGKMASGKPGARGRPVHAHRVAYELFVGPISAGLSVCHHCDVPACVNPAHLFTGTNFDNMGDAARKGRMRGHSSPGEANPKARLTLAEVEAIRQSADRSMLLAQQYGVSRQQIWLIRTGRGWTQ